MGASRRRLGGLVLAATLTVGLTSGVAAGTATADQGRTELRAAMTALTEAGVAGVQLRIHDEQGDWTGSAGVRELSGGKVPTNGRFRAGSITKTFMTTVVLQLVNEGKVVLDDPIEKYLPRYGFDPRITVRMLLRHTSGLFNYTGDVTADGIPDPGIPLFGTDFVENRFRTYTPAELIDFALSKPARFAPGTDWRYSNTNFIVIGQLVERVTGTPYAVQVQRRILAPLHLRETVFPGTRKDIPGPHAHGYYAYWDAGQFHVLDATRINPSWAGSAGEIISTTRDLDTFNKALLGGRLLPANLLAEMMTPSLSPAYGLGMELLDAGPTCGGVYYGHTGGIHGYQSLMFSNPDRTTRFEVSVTSGDADLSDPEVTARLSAALNNVVIAAICDSPPANNTMLVPEAA
jgi:D-alanyl-D-alanine carboxypeptidase